MKSQLNWIFITLIALSIFAVTLTAIPNSKASENIAMVSMFEPDEGVMIPVIKRMISPKDSAKEFLYHFVSYQYYFYGFPFFASSALAVFPLQLLGYIDKLPIVMLMLRLAISIFPMLFALLLLVYMHDQFKTYRSIILYLFLLIVPAVINNSFWWHPDGLVMLLSVLVLYFLWRDKHELGWNFLIAAIFCGILTATKLVGAYFFLAVGLSIVWAIFERKVCIRIALIKAITFIFIMIIAFVIANPFLLLNGDRTLYLDIIKKQSFFLSKGYGVIYGKGLSASWPLMNEYYGEAIFLIITLTITIWGIIKRETRFLCSLILAWFIPLTISILTFSHFKYQYWLPVAIPLFSNLILLLPTSKKDWPQKRLSQIVRILLLAVVALQMVFFLHQSAQLLIDRTQRADDHPAIAFYDRSMQVLAPISPDPVYAYYDYRLYLPEKENWVKETSFDLLDYAFIEQRHYDLLMLSQQRIWDYLNPSAVGVDPQQFALSQAFYQDADHGSIKGYHLLLRDETALLYIREDFCLRYFDQNTCP